MAKEKALEAGESPPDEPRDRALVKAALELAGQVTEDVEGLVETILKQRRRLDGAGGTHMDERWAREMETRMVKLETTIQVLAPVAMVREMIEPLQLGVKELTYSVKELTQSDLELKALHKELMVDRAKREEETHRKELQQKEAELELLRAQKAKTGTLVFITQKAQPVTSFVIAVGTLIGLVYGFIWWWGTHFTK